MNSSAPLDKRSLGQALADRSVALIEAPISGGVAIIAGHVVADMTRARPVLNAMGSVGVQYRHPWVWIHRQIAQQLHVGGRARATLRGPHGGQAFVLDPEVLVDALNGSSGRNTSTEVKRKPHVLTGTYGAGFAVSHMAKDVRAAAGLADGVGRSRPGLTAAAL